MNCSKKETKKLSFIVGRAIAIIAIVTVILSVAISAVVVLQKEYNDARNLLALGIEDIRGEVEDDEQDYLDECAALLEEVVINFIEENKITQESTSDDLAENVRINNFCEVDVTDDKGTIIYSSNPANIGCDINSPNDVSNLKKYGIYEMTQLDGYIMTGFDDETIQELTIEKIMDIVQHKHLGRTGSYLVCDAEFTVCASTEDAYNGQSLIHLTSVDDRNIRDMDTSLFFLTKLNGTYELIHIVKLYDRYIIALYPTAEAFERLSSTVISLLIIEAVLFPAIFLIVYIFLKRRVINGIISIKGSLAAIAEGDLSVKADVRSSREFGELSDNINTTVTRLDEMARKEAKMLEDELSYARSIQQAALPGKFPERPDFGIYASMKAAKEVGGDFYDFYMISPDKLIFLVADVSGKGIPAALFMMSAKSVIKSLSEHDLSAEEIFTRANRELSGEGDTVDMFVTAWMGILDLTTGNLVYVNAGHNPPILIHEDRPSYIEQDPEMVMCAFDNYEYKQQEITLCAGDSILLYTDGVTEAKNKQRINYGEDRLQQFLSGLDPDKAADIKEACRKKVEAILEDVSAYAQDEPQSDDITILCVTFRGRD